ncbi:MAG: response regulator transcription factor [Brachybacterium sp.]
MLLRIAQGRSNREVGEELFISDHTVKTHVGRLLTKLGLRDRVQLVIFAYDNGLVSPAP